MSRLRAFHMREIVWVGQPRFVIEGRAKAEELIVQWAKDWEVVGTFETANDMFFTQDYAVKASFQRQQQAKKELRLLIPFEKHIHQRVLLELPRDDLRQGVQHQRGRQAGHERLPRLGI